LPIGAAGAGITNGDHGQPSHHSANPLLCYGFCDVEDIEAFSRIENATYNLGLPIVIRSRQGKHGTEYSVAGGPWCYRLREAMEKMKAVQE